MALFGNLGVKLRGCLCGVPRYASAQLLVLTRSIHAPRPLGPPSADPIPPSCGIVLDLADPDGSGLNWKLTLVPIRLNGICGWALSNGSVSPPMNPFLVKTIQVRRVFVDVGVQRISGSGAAFAGLSMYCLCDLFRNGPKAMGDVKRG
jgi:hypothetical protein